MGETWGNGNRITIRKGKKKKEKLSGSLGAVITQQSSTNSFPSAQADAQGQAMLSVGADELFWDS